MRIRLIISCLLLAAGMGSPANGQTEKISLEDAIALARMRSVAALEAKEQFVATYWAWRSYMASRFPAIYLYGNVGRFNRSLTLLQSPDDGNMRYVATNNLQNGIGLRARQNIGITGGTIMLYSDINRIDQFGKFRERTWYSQPLTLSYDQPLFAYNQFKWDRMIQPLEYERGRRSYLEDMEALSERVVTAFFTLATANAESEMVRQNAEDTGKALKIAEGRLEIGTVTHEEYLQLQLRSLSDSLRISTAENRARVARLNFGALTAIEEKDMEPVMETEIPRLTVERDFILEKASMNTSFGLAEEISLLESESDLAHAKAQRGLSVSLEASFGLSRSDASLRKIYRYPFDQELISLTFSIPLFDWGEGRGRVQRAKAALEVAKAKSNEREVEYRQTLTDLAGRFNSQYRRCEVSARAYEIATERYRLLVERFSSGVASVTDLNNARSEKDSATLDYLQDIGTFWSLYYNIRRATLYDFIAGKDIEIDEKEMEDYR